MDSEKSMNLFKTTIRLHNYLLDNNVLYEFSNNCKIAKKLCKSTEIRLLLKFCYTFASLIFRKRNRICKISGFKIVKDLKYF